MASHRTFGALALALLGACHGREVREPLHGSEPALVFTRSAMGARFQIALPGDDEEQLLELAERCFAEVERLERLLSNWSPSSAISRLNADPEPGRRSIDPELARVLRAALDFCAESDGAFDPTVGALLRALGFYDQQPVRAPTPAEREALLARTGCGLLTVGSDAAEAFVERSIAGIEIDLSGVSKGWAVDRVVSVLRRAGVTDAFVAAGPSTVYGLGSGPDGRGWPFEVPAPDGGTQTWRLRDEAVATSGSLAFTVDVGGVEESHVIDPSTGHPVRHTIRTTVFRCASATEADMTSTALLVMGAERGAAWLAERGGGLQERAVFVRR